MPGETSAIPVGTGSTPDLVRLPEFLQAAITHSGNRSALEASVWEAPVRRTLPETPPTRRKRSLPLEAAIQYGLLTRDREATELTRSLSESAPPELYEHFARHILLELGGLRVVEGIRQMNADNLKISGDSLAEYLTAQGFRVSVHNTAINSMRMWLSLTGVFPTGRSNAWHVSEEAVTRLIGLDRSTVTSLSDLNGSQRGFLEALCVIEPDGWYPAAEVRNWVETTKGIKIGRQSLPKSVLDKLGGLGFVEVDTGGTRSGKSSKIRTTEKFQSEALAPFLKKTLRDLESAVAQYYTTRPADIYGGLTAPEPHVRGASLEAYTIHLMRLLGLQFVAWRKRSAETGHAEVDILMTGLLGGLPTRWQLQCKSTKRSIRLEDVAKEVGLLPLTAATHIMFVANAPVTDDARTFANKIMTRSATTIFLLDKNDFKKIRKTPTEIAQVLRQQSERILRLRSQNPFSRD